MKSRRTLAVLAIAALLAFVFAVMDHSQRGEARHHPQAVVAAASGVVAMGTPRVTAVSQALPRIAHVANAEALQPPPLPFSFLGKITEGGRTSILLYAGGRTLKVRGIGPLDDRYEVDSVHEDHLVLRYLALGATQVLALSSRQYAIAGGSPSQMEQD